jgi:hypothetical protein
MKKFYLQLMITLSVLIVLTSPHLLYMFTFDTTIYINGAGKLVTHVYAWGIPYTTTVMCVLAGVSVVLGSIITNAIKIKD